jgi:hypothetical protein
MTALQQKINLINWLTEYHISIIKRVDNVMVELKHRKGFNTMFMTAPTEKRLIEKLDSFITNRMK